MSPSWAPATSTDAQSPEPCAVNADHPDSGNHVRVYRVPAVFTNATVIPPRARAVTAGGAAVDHAPEPISIHPSQSEVWRRAKTRPSSFTPTNQTSPEMSTAMSALTQELASPCCTRPSQPLGGPCRVHSVPLESTADIQIVPLAAVASCAPEGASDPGSLVELSRPEFGPPMDMYTPSTVAGPESSKCRCEPEPNPHVLPNGPPDP